MRTLTLGNFTVSDDDPCYVIAEIGHNHGGSVATARQMIHGAAACGVHAVKLQKRDVLNLYTREILDAPYDNEHSFGPTYGRHRMVLEFGAVEYRSCQDVARSEGVLCFATAFDEASADFLMTLGVPAIKLASCSLTDTALITYVSRLGVPVILSTGGSTWAECDAAVNVLTSGPAPFALLHCTVGYPVQNAVELNLLAIGTMRDRYPDTVIGWSGHDPGVNLSLVAYAYGARIIEKHFTLNRASKGTDHAFSLEPRGMATLCEDLLKVHVANGDGVKRLYESERKPLSKMRRVRTTDGMQVTGALLYAHH